LACQRPSSRLTAPLERETCLHGHATFDVAVRVFPSFELFADWNATEVGGPIPITLKMPHGRKKGRQSAKARIGSPPVHRFVIRLLQVTPSGRSMCSLVEYKRYGKKHYEPQEDAIESWCRTKPLPFYEDGKHLNAKICEHPTEVIYMIDKPQWNAQQ